MKGWIFDIFTIGIAFIALTIVMVIFTYIWWGATPYFQNIPNLNATQTASITSFGNNYFYYSPDAILIIFYFMMVIAAFMAASYEAADANTFAVGLLFLIIAIIVSMPLSDFAHAFLSNPSIRVATQWYTNTMYILNYLPDFTGILTLAYLIFVVTRSQGFMGGARAAGIRDIIQG